MRIYDRPDMYHLKNRTVSCVERILQYEECYTYSAERANVVRATDGDARRGARRWSRRRLTFRDHATFPRRVSRAANVCRTDMCERITPIDMLRIKSENQALDLPL